MRPNKPIALLALALAAASCGENDSDDGSDGGGGDGDGDGDGAGDDGGGDDGTPSGDPVGSCLIEDYGFCNDYWADTADGLENLCLMPGVWSLTEFCDPAGACGTCTTDAGDFVAKTYYFDGSGPEDMSKIVCENGQGVWLDDPDISCS